MVTVTSSLVEVGVAAGAMAVPEPRENSGIVTVTSKVAVWPGLSGYVTVKTEIASV
jgi:hypothetical protein